MLQDRRKIVKKENYDVIVVGGGIAGISAAVSASRNGVSTLLIEKKVNLGGLATGGLISWYEPLCDGEGTQMVKGIAEELIKLSAKYSFDNLPEQWGGSGHNKPKNQRYSTNFSPTVFTLSLDEFVLSNGVKLRFDTLGTYPVMDGNNCVGVVCESVSGKEFFGAKVVIDATGTAVIMDGAGVPTVVGENFMSYVVHKCSMDGAKHLVDDADFSKFRKWASVGSDLFGNGHPAGMRLLKGISAEDVTDYVVYGKSHLLERLKGEDKDSFDIMTLPDMAQFRTIRRIQGKTYFNAIDGEKFADSIGDSGDFRPQGIGKHYQIPFGALYNPDFPNLLAAGRIISAPQGDGWEVARVIPTCALTGEAAGKAAALKVNKGYTFDEIAENHIDEVVVR